MKLDIIIHKPELVQACDLKRLLDLSVKQAKDFSMLVKSGAAPIVCSASQVRGWTRQGFTLLAEVSA